jgi:hypothetical protein
MFKLRKSPMETGGSTAALIFLFKIKKRTIVLLGTEFCFLDKIPNEE